jgi:hypothetical protein
MMLNLNECFEEQCKIFLKDLQFGQYNESASVKGIKFCDELETVINGDHLIVVFTRSIKMEPEEAFKLSVSFGLDLTFRYSYLKENKIDLNMIDFKNELIHNGQNILNLLIGRTVLLIAQITAVSSNNPIIAPPIYITP